MEIWTILSLLGEAVSPSTKLIIIWSAVLAIALLSSTKYLSPARRKPKHVHGSADWASIRDIRNSGLLECKGPIIGLSKKNHILSYSADAHIAVIGPTRCGKGVGIVISTLLSWPGSVLVVDPKFENYKKTAGYRSTLGHCFRFSPTATQSHRFNPLDCVRSDHREVGDVMAINSILTGLDTDKLEQAHWQDSAWALLATVMLYAIHHYPKKNLYGMFEVLNNPQAPIKDTLEKMLESDHLNIQLGARNMLNKHDEELSSIVSTASRYLSIYSDPVIAGHTDSSDFTLDQLMQDDKPTSLYLSIPPGDMARTKDLFRLLITLAVHRLTETPDNPKSKYPLLIIFDEFTSFGRIDFFENALSFLAGYGIKVILIAHNYDRIHKVYGRDTSVISQCECKVYFTPNEYDTAKKISDELGQQTIRKSQQSYSIRSHSWSHGSLGRQLMMPDEIETMSTDEEIIVLKGYKRIKAKRFKYYDDRTLSARADWRLPSIRKLDLTKQPQPVELQKKQKIREITL